MICEVCNNNEANVHFTKIVSISVKEEKKPCEKCAREIQGFNITSKLEMNPFFISKYAKWNYRLYESN